MCEIHSFSLYTSEASGLMHQRFFGIGRLESKLWAGRKNVFGVSDSRLEPDRASPLPPGDVSAQNDQMLRRQKIANVVEPLL